MSAPERCQSGRMGRSRKPGTIVFLVFFAPSPSRRFLENQPLRQTAGGNPAGTSVAILVAGFKAWRMARIALASQQGAWANIPPKRNRKDPIYFSPYLYRTRNLVERFFNKIKQCRRVATRYDKLAANYLAFIKLASIRLWLRVYESTA